MSVDKIVLTTNIYSDLSQEDIVIENGENIPDVLKSTTNVSIRARKPGALVDNVFELAVNTDYYDEDDERKGNIKNPGITKDLTTAQIEEAINTGVVPEVELDEETNLKKMQAKAFDNHRLAFVLSDRVLDHIVDNLETKEAADNIVEIREKLQEVIDNIKTMADDMRTIADFMSAQSDSYSQLLSLLQQTLSAISGVAPSAATAIPQLITMQTTYALANIKTATANINSDMTQSLSDLDNISSSLDNIIYNNSKSVI